MKGLVEDLTQNIQRILFDTFKDHESILIILISKNDKIITFKLGATTASKISNNTVQKITKNSIKISKWIIFSYLFMDV